MRLYPAIISTLLSAFFVAVALSSHLTLSAQELFHNTTLPRDWTYSQVVRPRLKALAEPDAVNCGRASVPSPLEKPVLHLGVSQDTSPLSLEANDVSDCALQAHASRKSFYARYDIEGLDSIFELGLAFDGRKAYAVMWQSMGIGGGEHTLEVKDCPLPITITKNKWGWLDCFAPDPNKARTPPPS